MESKRVYDYLAQIYFGRHQEKERRYTLKLLLGANIVLFSAVLALLAISLMHSPHPLKPAQSPSLEINFSKPVEFEYDFSQPGVERAVFNITLPHIDLRGFNALKMAVKTAGPQPQDLPLGIEIENIYSEKDDFYISGINNHWKEYIIPLKNFKKIADFSQVKKISFKIERWNVSKNKGSFYIDKIEFLKERREI